MALLLLLAASRAGADCPSKPFGVNASGTQVRRHGGMVGRARTSSDVAFMWIVHSIAKARRGLTSLTSISLRFGRALQCMNLQRQSATTAASCAQKCCDVAKCTLWQFRPLVDLDLGGGCWINQV